jgi:competence protein ComEC
MRLLVPAAAVLIFVLPRRGPFSFLPGIPVSSGAFAGALGLGIVCGFLAAAGTGNFAPGLPAERIYSLRGKLLDDPRSLPSVSGSGGSRRNMPAAPEEERGMAYLKLEEAGAFLPGAAAKSSARGRVPVFFPPGTLGRVKEFGRGAEVYVEGAFLSGEPARGPRFRAVSAHTIRPAPAPERIRTAVRSALLARLEEKPWGGLAAALLLGTRENLDDELARSFRDAGLAHILALSGMHLAFLSALLAFSLKKPLGKKGAILAGLVFIILYVFLVGPQPSLIRAAIMYILGSCLFLAGMGVRPLILLGISFLIQILLDPPSARSLSFILSYLALGGILLLGNTLDSLFRGLLPPWLAGGLAPSLGAFLATAPAAAACFGILRPAGIVVGLIAAPLSGVFMAFSLGALVLEHIPGPAFLFDRILVLLQLILQRTVSAFSRGLAFKAAPLAVCLGLPPVLLLLFFLADRRNRYRNSLAPFA